MTVVWTSSSSASPTATAPCPLYYRVGNNVGVTGAPNTWRPVRTAAAVGNTFQGAGVAIVNLDSNPRPEIIVMAHDIVNGWNDFRWRIGYNPDNSGLPTPTGPSGERWRGVTAIPGCGTEADGAGLAAGDIDGNGRPDLVFTAYDDPAGNNEYRYKVLLNPDRRGSGTLIPADVRGYRVRGQGHTAEGAGLALVNLDEDPRLELIVMSYDTGTSASPANRFNYKIGWNLDKRGQTLRWTSRSVAGMGNDGEGAGMAALKLDNDLRGDLVFMAEDTGGGANRWNDFRMRTERNQIGRVRSFGKGCAPNSQIPELRVQKLSEPAPTT